MATLENAVRDVLLAAPAVSGAVGTRVRPLVVSQGDALPYLTTDVVRDDPIQTLEGGCEYVPATIEVGVFAGTYRVCAELGEAVRDALHMYGGTAAGIEFAPAIFQGETDIESDTPDGAEKPVYCRVLTFSVLYRKL